jgi:hypothetical protein
MHAYMHPYAFAMDPFIYVHQLASMRTRSTPFPVVCVCVCVCVYLGRFCTCPLGPLGPGVSRAGRGGCRGGDVSDAVARTEVHHLFQRPGELCACVGAGGGRGVRE